MFHDFPFNAICYFPSPVVKFSNEHPALASPKIIKEPSLMPRERVGIWKYCPWSIDLV